MSIVTDTAIMLGAGTAGFLAIVIPTLGNDDGTLFRLVLSILYLAVVIHLIYKRIKEVNRVDFIRPFRIWLLAILAIVLVTTIPVIVFLFYRWLGIPNEALRDLATIMGGIGPLALVIGLEIGDIVIDRTRAHAKLIAQEERVTRKSKRKK